jgi:hypothetical protein
MSITGFHPFRDKILSQNLQAVADQGCHLKGSSPYKGTACRGVYCTFNISKLDCLYDQARERGKGYVSAVFGCHSEH